MIWSADRKYIGRHMSSQLLFEVVVSDFILDLDPPSDSYRETRREKNSKVRGPVDFCDLNAPKNEHFSLEPFDSKKYKKLPETIKILLPLVLKVPEKKEIKIPDTSRDATKNQEKRMKKKNKCTIL
ncbi:Protein CBG20432 [Caenorhabditis briggsae]|uniref:Protein CBG20401 n=1 Tax=Caenorhabditis briggsae TaxID=6238 RepID=G2J709_CAEBR|nr:Protein CBG20401 [Caenorhabditis briggsae]XP_002646574.1 Protein CBG20432 [Caenorhabditis briggsae]CAP37415.1 Protein CBG20401 [Caenorhabditis briggsae]CAP37445.1 Protein CBG20432 [Caenorhabditis briggsae]